MLMLKLLLDRRQNYLSYLLTERPEGSVAYLLPNGERRVVAWRGFIERGAARQLAGARPVRLSDITWIGEGDVLSMQWREVGPGRYVHGCLTDRGAYAVYGAVVAVVGGPKGR